MNPLLQYRLINWTKAESARIVAPGTSCTHCRSVVNIRFTKSGVYCYNCYMNLPKCKRCDEPSLDEYPLCRSHWQKTFENDDPDAQYLEAIRVMFHSRDNDPGGDRVDLFLNVAVLSVGPAKPCPGGPHHIYQPGARVCNCGARTVGEGKK